MPRLTACAFAAALIALPMTAAAQDASTVVAQDASTVVAKVGETEITLGHVILMRQQLPQQYAQLADDVLLDGIVNQLVEQHLLGQGVAETDLMRLKIENEQRALRAAETIQSIMEVPVSEDDVTAYYNEQFLSGEVEQEFNASHILVETEEEAQALVTELEGGADFAELAKEKSTGPSGPNGGQLGWFAKGAMVPEFEAAVLDLAPEQVSAPVKTQFGWHVVRLNEVRDIAPPELTEVRPQIEQQLRQDRITERLAELREETEVELLFDALPADIIRNDAIVSGN